MDKARLIFKDEGCDDYNGANAWVAVDADAQYENAQGILLARRVAGFAIRNRALSALGIVQCDYARRTPWQKRLRQ